MKKIKLSAQDFGKFDAYLEQYAEQKLAKAYSKVQQRFKREHLEQARLPLELKSKNDARIMQFMEDVAAGAPYTKPIISNLWASLGTIAAPTSDQQLAGWGLSTPPESYFFNWFYNTVEKYLGHINQYGICVWDNQTDYPINGLVQGSDGQIYRGKVSPNVNLNPVGDSGTNWQIVISSEGGGDNPVGSFLFLAYNDGQPVSHYLDCLHQEISRTEYAALFAKISTIWGVGNGTTTFNLPPPGFALVGQGWGGYPDLADTTGITGGEAQHTLTIAEMPAHDHGPGSPATYLLGIATGLGNIDATTTVPADGFKLFYTGLAGGDRPHNNIQPSMVCRLLIKYQ